MSKTEPDAPGTAKGRGLTLEDRAVVLAFVLAALFRVGLFKHIPW